MKKTTKSKNSMGIAKLFTVIGRVLEKTDPEALTNFLITEFDIKKTTLSSSQKKDNQTDLDLNTQSSIDLKGIAEALKQLPTREDGHDLLINKKLNRKNLEGVGRILGVPILKTDNIERLTAKIIEASIGARLNSDAIRGKSE